MVDRLGKVDMAAIASAVGAASDRFSWLIDHVPCMMSYVRANHMMNEDSHIVAHKILKKTNCSAPINSQHSLADRQTFVEPVESFLSAMASPEASTFTDPFAIAMHNNTFCDPRTVQKTNQAFSKAQASMAPQFYGRVCPDKWMQLAGSHT